MTAIPAGQTSSLIELGAAKIGAVMAGRRAKRDGRGGIFSFLGELFGTLAAMACFVVAAFVVGFAVGMSAAGVALLLIDFKVSMMRRARATAPPVERQRMR